MSIRRLRGKKRNELVGGKNMKIMRTLYSGFCTRREDLER